MRIIRLLMFMVLLHGAKSGRKCWTAARVVAGAAEGGRRRWSEWYKVRRGSEGRGGPGGGGGPVSQAAAEPH